jgi:gamma-glutamyltranspeptidase / glutathione hydrolase
VTPIVTSRGMAATSHPLATRAAVLCLEDGGNACDAAVCAAAVLCVCEPMSTGLGGDCFAITWRNGVLDGLNSSGRAPLGADPDQLGGVMPLYGPRSVTVPGAVRGWAALLDRYGSWGLDRCLHAAIDAAERGFAVGPVIASVWREPLETPPREFASVFLPPPPVGSTVTLPALAATLRRIAAAGPDGFYHGPVADAICASCWLEHQDLAAHHAEWVAPLTVDYGDVTVCELPPNGQGAAALQALGIADGLDVTGPDADRVHHQAEAMKLAFADAYRYIADQPLPAGYLDAEYLAARRALVDPDTAASPAAGMLPRGDTVYLCVVDESRMACSFIQSVYHSWGSRVVAPGTGVVLQNRGAGFTLDERHPNRLAPGRRPYHTIIPGMLVRGGELVGPFGLMGGHVQPQGHLQLVTHLVTGRLDPQTALDQPRWRLDQEPDGWVLCLEPGLWHAADDLERRGHLVVRDSDRRNFGGGQCILVHADALVGGSEPRKDGQASGY